mmetsp:Transcript_48424/g.156203  ORF Transcript_48424/g.156203 Transcript_48424/m.156203 type:complete len:699 (-) Transcript_48424:926-3022(-)
MVQRHKGKRPPVRKVRLIVTNVTLVVDLERLQVAHDFAVEHNARHAVGASGNGDFGSRRCSQDLLLAEVPRGVEVRGCTVGLLHGAAARGHDIPKLLVGHLTAAKHHLPRPEGEQASAVARELRPLRAQQRRQHVHLVKKRDEALQLRGLATEAFLEGSVVDDEDFRILLRPVHCHLPRVVEQGQLAHALPWLHLGDGPFFLGGPQAEHTYGGGGPGKLDHDLALFAREGDLQHLAHLPHERRAAAFVAAARGYDACDKVADLKGRVDVQETVRNIVTAEGHAHAGVARLVFLRLAGGGRLRPVVMKPFDGARNEDRGLRPFPEFHGRCRVTVLVPQLLPARTLFGQRARRIVAHHTHEELLFSGETIVDGLARQAGLDGSVPPIRGRGNEVEGAPRQHEKIVRELAALQQRSTLGHTLVLGDCGHGADGRRVEDASSAEVRVVLDCLHDEDDILLTQFGALRRIRHRRGRRGRRCHALTILDLTAFVDGRALRKLQLLVQAESLKLRSRKRQCLQRLGALAINRGRVRSLRREGMASEVVRVIQLGALRLLAPDVSDRDSGLAGVDDEKLPPLFALRDDPLAGQPGPPLQCHGQFRQLRPRQLLLAERHRREEADELFKVLPARALGVPWQLPPPRAAAAAAAAVGATASKPGEDAANLVRAFTAIGPSHSNGHRHGAFNDDSHCNTSLAISNWHQP